MGWCGRTSRAWSLGPDYCMAMQDPRFIIVYTFLNVTSDFAVLLIPIFIIKTLKLRGGDFFAMAFLMGLGCLTMSPTIIRACYLKSVVGAKAMQENMTPQDMLSSVHICELWSFAEMTAAITAVSLPSLRVLMKRSHPGSRLLKTFKSWRSTTTTRSIVSRNTWRSSHGGGAGGDTFVMLDSLGDQSDDAKLVEAQSSRGQERW